jgi:hypothetical protein
MTQGSPQSVTQMNTRYLPWVVGSWCVRLITSPPSVSQLPRAVVFSLVYANPQGVQRHLRGYVKLKEILFRDKHLFNLF